LIVKYENNVSVYSYHFSFWIFIVIHLIRVYSIFAILFLSLTCASCSAQDKQSHTRPQFGRILLGEPATSLGKNIDCILQLNNGDYWIGTNGDGVYRYSQSILTHYTTKDGLVSDFVLGIQEDKHGRLWFTNRDGISQYDGLQFFTYTDSIKNAKSGPLNMQKGGLFFGQNRKICYYDGHTFTSFEIHPESYKPHRFDNSRPYSMYCSLISKNGTMVFGTESKGVCLFDGKKKIYLTEQLLGSAAVRTVFEDSKGMLWFGNNGGGLYSYDGKTLRNITEEHHLGNPDFLNKLEPQKDNTLARVFSINEDKNGLLWIGTIDAGVWSYDGTNLKQYTEKDGLTGSAIWSISKNNAGDLLYVTNGEKICTFDGERFQEFRFQ
jgi:hypothetical protein